MNRPPKSFSRQCGSMLLEALIGILIFSMGVLAVVGMQASAVKASRDAKYRSDASMVANQLIGQMWVGNRTPATMQANFQGSAGSGGSGYTAWLAEVQTALPGAVANPPAHPMPARSAAYELWPDSAPLFEAAAVSFPLVQGVAPAKNIHIYRHKGTSWARQDTTFQDGRATFKMDEAGVFMAMEDSAAPEIANVSPMEAYSAQTRRPEIRAEVSDAGSGIAAFSIACGGQWLLTAYDPEHGEIRWEQDEDLPSGPQTITLTLVDEAGNTRSYERKLVIP